jgi:hypothetical protein
MNKFSTTSSSAVIAVDIDTDVINGEDIKVILTSELELIDSIESIEEGNTLITLPDTNYPFSNDYNLVFSDGELISTSKITPIESYKITFETNSLSNIQIFRKKIRFEYEDEFTELIDIWSTFLATLSDAEIEELMPQFDANDYKDNSRTVNLTERAHFEFLYYYLMYNKREFTIEDNLNIRNNLSEVLLPDGRLPISNIRSGAPRYT